MTRPRTQGLLALHATELAPTLRARLRGLELLAGDPVWDARRRAEAHELLALHQIAPARIPSVDMLDARTELRAVFSLRVPVPCMPPEADDLVVAHAATLALRYPREAMVQRLPGAAFVQILAPRHVWHPQVHAGMQALCLADRLPIGTRVSELVLLAYRALAMQDTQVDELDPAGVFNAAAARWWQAHGERIPLSEEAFLATAGAGRQP